MPTIFTHTNAKITVRRITKVMTGKGLQKKYFYVKAATYSAHALQ